jgi:hypothetical protein
MARLVPADPILVLLALLGLAACGGPSARDDAPSEAPEEKVGLPDGAEGLSFLGDTLFAPELPQDVLDDRLARYREAEEALDAAPDDADALIWMGRRTA